MSGVGLLRTLAAAALTCAIAPRAAAQQPANAAADTGPRIGTIAGQVRDERSLPVAGAIVTVEGTARQARSDSTGRFVLERVPAGLQELSVRHIGYLPARAMVPVHADSAIVLSVTLRAEGQQLPGVVVEAQLLNQLGGIVLDDQYRPVAGATVDLVGLRRSMLTDAEGRFVFTDIPTGNFLFEVRAEGYAVARRGIQMVAHIERDVAVRLSQAAGERLTAALAAVVAQEADRRKSLAGARAVFVGRDELVRFGDAPLGRALLESSGGIALRDLRAGSGGGGTRGPTSIGGNRGSMGNSFGASRGGASPLSCVLLDGYEVPSGDMLGFLRASEVELVEIYPMGTENSRTLCGRFPPSSGCSCPPDPAGVVIWLKK